MTISLEFVASMQVLSVVQLQTGVNDKPGEDIELFYRWLKAPDSESSHGTLSEIQTGETFGPLDM